MSACAGCGNAFSCMYPDCDAGRQECRDYNDAEREMIRKGKPEDAKTAWHKRTKR